MRSFTLAQCQNKTPQKTTCSLTHRFLTFTSLAVIQTIFPTEQQLFNSRQRAQHDKTLKRKNTAQTKAHVRLQLFPNTSSRKNTALPANQLAGISFDDKDNISVLFQLHLRTSFDDEDKLAVSPAVPPLAPHLTINTTLLSLSSCSSSCEADRPPWQHSSSRHTSPL